MKKMAILVAFSMILTGIFFSDQKLGNVRVNPNLLKPTITQVTQKPSHGGLHHFVNLTGNFFGNTAGTREVRLGNHVLDTNQWAMQSIYTTVPWNVLFGQKYPVFIWDKAANKSVSNEIKFLLQIMPFLPEQANAQSQITITTDLQDIGNTQGTRKVIFGSMAAQIISWSNHSISVIVPNLYPGTYDCYIEDNGEIVSYKLPVKILPPLVK